jgi:hypothetical protein
VRKWIGGQRAPLVACSVAACVALVGIATSGVRLARHDPQSLSQVTTLMPGHSSPDPVLPLPSPSVLAPLPSADRPTATLLPELPVDPTIPSPDPPSPDPPDRYVPCTPVYRGPTAGASVTTISDEQEVVSDGWHPSIAIGCDGKGLISYFEAADGGGSSPRAKLKVAHCIDIACTRVTVSTLEKNLASASDSAIAIGSDGKGIIAYIASSPTTGERVRIAHCRDVSCLSADMQTIAPSADGCSYQSSCRLSIAIGSDGFAMIAYVSRGLRIARCVDVACASSSVSSLDPQAIFVATLAIGRNGRPLIAYRDTEGELKVSRCRDAACTSASVRIVDHALSWSSVTMTLGSDGHALILYVTNKDELKLARCDTDDCSVLSRRVLATGVITNVSIGVPADGRAVVVFSQHLGNHRSDLTVARCADPSCPKVSSQVVESDAVGKGSVAIGADNLPLITYGIQTSQTGDVDDDLRIVHCGDIACSQHAN